MKIAHEKWLKTSEWQYYIDTHIYTGDVFNKFVWLRRWWETYPVDKNGAVIEMYRTRFMKDPRKK